MNCFWSKCSDKKRCGEFGSCVALSQAGGVTFPTMEADSTPPSHQELFSAISHHAREIARLTEAPPAACRPECPPDKMRAIALLAKDWFSSVDDTPGTQEKIDAIRDAARDALS